jgi:tetratricopeptide (TPR) repeat protein
MQKRLLSLAFVLFLSVTISMGISSFLPEGLPTQQAETHYQKGMKLYNKGFYEFMSKNQLVEANQYFQRAEKELLQQLEEDPGHIQAGLALARVYHVQKKFLKAAQQYQKMTELNPADLDTYALAANSYAKAKCFQEAEDQILKAMALASEPGSRKVLQDIHRKLEKQRDIHEKRRQKEGGHE